MHTIVYKQWTGSSGLYTVELTVELTVVLTCHESKRNSQRWPQGFSLPPSSGVAAGRFHTDPYYVPYYEQYYEQY